MSVLRVFIADDEEPARQRLKELLADIGAEVSTVVAGEAGNALETLDRVPGSGAQVLLLDIQMPGMSGLELARHVARLPDAPAVIFVTAHDRHALEAFELYALDYLLKPVRAARLAEALRRARARVGVEHSRLDSIDGAAREFLSVNERNRIVLVPVRDVLYFKAELKYVTLRTRASEHLIEEPLVALEQEFSEHFVRIHRNCLVARAAIRGFERAGGDEEELRWLVLLDGVPEKLPVSRRQWPVLRGFATEH